MPRQVALIICISIILYLFWMDRKNNENVSRAIWIPFIWMAIAVSRFVSHWLNLGSPQMVSADAALDGSPIDRAVFMILILGAIITLVRRKPHWSALFKNNPWIWLYFAFGALSFLWCDNPFIAFKRWIKSLGTVSMILIILTEERPYLALGVILKRLSFLLLPLSVLFIKYYPELGRAYHMGQPMYTGVGTQKNSLGLLCSLTGIYFFWNLLYGRRNQNYSGERLHYSIYIIVLPMIAWLLYMAQSVTSQVCLAVAIGIFLAGRHTWIMSKPQRIITVCVFCIVLFIIMDFAFDIKASIISLLGRRPDLTNRVYIWERYLSMVRNPLIGYGFESFYSSAAMQDIDEPIYSAHNAYLEMYLNLGYVGLLFVFAWILSGLTKVYNHLAIDYPAAILRLAIIVVACLFSWSEASFAGVSSIWLLLLFTVMTIPDKNKNTKSMQAK